MLLELPTGAFADLVGKKVTVQMACFFMAISVLIFLLATNFWQFLLATIVQGLAESLRSGAREALLYDTLVEDGREKEFKTINSKIISIDQVALVVATFLGGYLATFDMRLPAIIFAICLIIATIVAGFIKEPSVDTEKFTFKNYLKQTKDGTKQIFRNKKIARLSLLYMLVGGIGWTFQRMLRDMILIDVGYQAPQIALITGLIRLFNVFVMLRILKHVKKNGGAGDVIILPLLMVITYLAAFWLNPTTSVFITTGLMLIGTGRFMLLNPYLQQEIESKYRATAMSAANMLVCLVLALNMFVLGVVMDYVSLSSVAIFYGFISLVFVLPLALRVRKDFVE